MPAKRTKQLLEPVGFVSPVGPQLRKRLQILVHGHASIPAMTAGPADRYTAIRGDVTFDTVLLSKVASEPHAHRDGDETGARSGREDVVVACLEKYLEARIV
jgi:hypothetical protein